MNTQRPKHFIILFIVLFLFSFIVLFAYYLHNIHIGGEVYFRQSRKSSSITTVSPLNHSTLNHTDTIFTGYYKSIEVAKDQAVIDDIAVNRYLGKTILLKPEIMFPDKYIYVNSKLNLTDKIRMVLYYNRWLILKLGISLFCLILMYWSVKKIIVNFNKYYITIIRWRNMVTKAFKLIKNRRSKMDFSYYKARTKAGIFLVREGIYHKGLRCLKINLVRVKRVLTEKLIFFRTHMIRLIIAVFLSLCVYPFLLFLLKIDFAVLYGCSVWIMYPIISCIFLIPITGLVLSDLIKRRMPVFFAFWIIFLLHYFFISPGGYAGNFGFYGAFHNFIDISMKFGFFRTIVIPDCSYLAFLPRLIYGISYAINPSVSQIMAITSIAALFIYSFIFSHLLHKGMTFLWINKSLAFVFVVFISIFPVFSLVPGSSFPLPITDVAYYGVLFAIISLFIVKYLKTPYVIGLILFNCILMLSKAHMVVLLPVYIIGSIVFYTSRNKKAFVFTIFCLAAILIQALYCFSRINQLGGSDSHYIASFSIQSMSLMEQILYTVIYFIKSFIAVLFPFLAKSGNVNLWAIILAGSCIIALFYKSLRMLFTEKDRLIALWFLSCFVTAFASTFFYAYTLSYESTPVHRHSLQFIHETVPVFMRYTIGINTLIAVSVLPFIAILLQRLLIKLKCKYAKKLSIIFFSLLLFYGFFSCKNTYLFPEFWSLVRNDRWSEEWKHIAPLLRQKEYYLPIVFYPAYKQNMCTRGVETALDISPGNQSSFKLSTPVKVSSVIVLNQSLASVNEMPFYAELFLGQLKVKTLIPFYPPDSNNRFIIFNSKGNSSADSIAFKNKRGESVQLNSHIRLVSWKENNDKN